MAFCDPKGENVALVAKRSIFVFFKGGLQGGGCPFKKDSGFRARLEVPGGSLGGVSSRLVGPWGLQEPGGQVFFGARGSP